MKDIIFDMETQDPDDILTLCFLAAHPLVNLRAVTITPGSDDQVTLVKEVLKIVLPQDFVLVGSREPGYPKYCVSGFHWKVIPRPEASVPPDDVAHNVLAIALRHYPDATLITGAPLTNLRLMFENHPDVILNRWFGQGGYVGCNVQPNQEELERFGGVVPFPAPRSDLEKFENKEYVPTFNFGGDREAALMALTDQRIKLRCLVGKNVCHGVVYDSVLHDSLTPHLKNDPGGMGLFWKFMNTYLQKKPFKKLHDPLTAAAAIDPNICQFVEVRYKSQKNHWGADLAEGTNTWGAIAVDKTRFVSMLTSASLPDTETSDTVALKSK